MTVDAGRADRWDFFISYTQADRAWAEWIAWILEEAGYRVLIQAWDLVPGSNWIQRMQDGITGAERTVAVLSPDYLAGQYATAEWQAAWKSDPAGLQRKLLITRVRECERPGLLSGVVGEDLFGIPEAEAQVRVRKMVSAAISGRAKPGVAPAFPGSRAIDSEPRFPGALPRIWKVPARNPNFTGRGQELAMLVARVKNGSPVTVQALHGMGGVGKTQLAAEYCHARASDYDLVYWIAAEEPATIADQFTALASRLGLASASGADPGALQMMVHDQLRNVPGWLLVFDNANEVAHIRDWLPTSPLPPGMPGHVIVTTRRRGFAALGSVLELDVIDLPSSVTLLQTRVRSLAHNAAEQIAEELGRLPLALEQAAAYLDKTGMPGLEYLDLLRRRASELYTRGQVSDRRDTIATLWDITLERISAKAPAAVILLQLCAYLAPEPIPPNLFTQHTNTLPPPLDQAAADPLAFSEAIGTLVDYSLAKRTEAGLQLHRLVQGVIRARSAHIATGPPGQGQPATVSISMLEVVLSLLSADAPRQILGAPQDWPRWAELLPHVLAAVSHLGLPGEQQHTASDNAVWLLDRAATYLEVHARLAEAQPLAERALTIAQEAHGPDHPLVAARVGNLALILDHLGKPHQARPLAERALTIHEAACGPDHPLVAIDLSNLASILVDLGESHQARPLAERALTIHEAACGPDHPTVAIDLSNLAAILLKLGQPRQARPLAERALTIDEETYSFNHPRIATGLGNLAAILQDLKQPDQARPLAERALTIDETVYGPDHPAVATRLGNLATVLKDLRQFDQARPLAERALTIDETVYGPDHPAVGIRLSNLSGILQNLGQADQALPLAQRAWAIHEATYGPGHLAVAIDLINLVTILQDLGQLGRARPLAERALTIYQATYGPYHPSVIRLRYYLDSLA